MTAAHVAPGGPVHEQELSHGVWLTKFSVGPGDNNCYLLRHADGGSVLIDAAAEPERIAEVLGRHGPDVIITTHQHEDHLQALAAIAAARASRLLAGAPDLTAIAQRAGVRGLQPLHHQDVVTSPGVSLEVIATPGHTPGSIVLCHAGQTLFTGDSLFPGGPGRTADRADFTELMTHLQERIFRRFGDEVAVHPGHGDSTTLGAERPQLPLWWARGW